MSVRERDRNRQTVNQEDKHFEKTVIRQFENKIKYTRIFFLSNNSYI